MRIAFLTPEFVTEKKFDGGLANYLQRTSFALKNAGHEPEVFVATDRTEDIEFHGILVHRVQAFSLFDWRVMRIGCRLLRQRWLSSWEALCIARAVARGFAVRHAQAPFDIVQASDFQASGLCVSRSFRIPVITRLSYYGPACRRAYERAWSVDGWLRENLEARSVRKSRCVYAPSRSLATQVGRALGLTVDTIHPPAYLDVAPGDEDASVYEARLSRKRYVLFFGRICRPKGVYALAQALAGVLADDRGLWLVMAGREDPRGIMGELRGLLGATASARTLHLDRMVHSQLYPVVRHAACVCLPSRVDNFPNTCLEAMALGQVVVGTRNTGFEDLIHDGVDGLLVDPDDPAALARTVTQVLRMDPAERQRMACAAKARVAEFAPDRVVPRLIAYYVQSQMRR